MSESFKSRPILTCAQCGRTFKRTGHFNQHMRVHTGERPYKCDFPGCGRDFSRSDNLRRHRIMHDDPENPEQDFLCPRNDCGKSFRSKYHLDRHVALHDRPTSYKCSLCPASFSKKRGLGEHNANVHGGERPYKCQETGCASAFARPFLLRRHFIQVHTEKTYICLDDACRQLPAFTKFSDLQRHLRRDHRNSVFDCDQCGKSFTRAADLRKHEETHKVPLLARINFRCHFPNCNATYSSKSNLGTHVRSKHTECDAFLCEMCLQTFSLKSSLKRHITNVHLKADISSSGAPASHDPSSASAVSASPRSEQSFDEDLSQPPLKKRRLSDCDIICDTQLRTAADSSNRRPSSTLVAIM